MVMTDPWTIPAWLRLTREERAEGWREHPPVPMPRFDAAPRTEEPATRRLREQLEDAARAKKEQGLAALAAWKEDHRDELPVRKRARRISKGRSTITKRRRVSKMDKTLDV